MAVCAYCGQENPDEARFCLACGQPLAIDDREVRKTVTILFSDVEGSTRLGERLDAESLRRVMTRYYDEARVVLERHGGSVEKFIGDAVVAVFGIPVVHEDDALRAVRAAVELRDAIAALNAELAERFGIDLRIRIGVNTGEVVTGEGADSFATGDAVNVAARLEQTADAGEILVGGTTWALVRDAVQGERLDGLAVRGRDAEVEAYRLERLDADAVGVRRREDGPFVGRVNELRLLTDAFERVERNRACHLFTLLGPAGVGKSRLVDEFLATVEGRAGLARGRCLAYGEGITFWPLAEIVKMAAGLAGEESPEEARARLAALLAGDEDAELVADRVGALVGLAGEAGGGEESFWAVRRLFGALARERPLVVVLEDVHWAEATFLDLIEHVADWARETPILLVCLARPELLEERPTWAGGKLNASSVLLEPLDRDEAVALIDQRLGAVDDAVRTRVADLSEGNPLFVEELLSMLVREGHLRRENGGWAAAAGDDLGALRIPATVQALLAARIDRLEVEERAVLERGALEGNVFHLGTVRALAPEADVDAKLLSLVRKELVRPERSTLPGEEAFRFRHILIRDAAYEAMPKETRAGLHERFAGWLLEKAGERALEYEEIVAYHLERAYRLREELGRLGADDRDLAVTAAARLAAAGRRAAERDDASGAASLLERAVSLLPEDDPERASLLVPLARARVEDGALEEAERLIGDAARLGAGSGDRGLEQRALLEQQFLRLRVDPEGTTDEARAVADRALAVLSELGDDAGLATAWDLLAGVHLMACRYGERAEALERALEHARRSGGEREAELIISLETAHFWGPTRVEEAVARCEARRAEGGHGPTVEAALVGTLAGLEAMRGRFEEARELYRRERAIHEDLGRPYSVAAWTMVHARVELLAGDPAAAEAELRSGYEILEAMGELGVLSTVAAYLARALEAQGRDEEALTYSRISEEAASSDDIASQALWRTTRARLAARGKSDDDAETLAREAVALAEPTDDLALRSQTLLALADVLRARDRSAEARDVVQVAVELSERKGDTVTAARGVEMLALG